MKLYEDIATWITTTVIPNIIEVIEAAGNEIGDLTELRPMVVRLACTELKPRIIFQVDLKEDFRERYRIYGRDEMFTEVQVLITLQQGYNKDGREGRWHGDMLERGEFRIVALQNNTVGTKYPNEELQAEYEKMLSGEGTPKERITKMADKFMEAIMGEGNHHEQPTMQIGDSVVGQLAHIHQAPSGRTSEGKEQVARFVLFVSKTESYNEPTSEQVQILPEEFISEKTTKERLNAYDKLMRDTSYNVPENSEYKGERQTEAGGKTKPKRQRTRMSKRTGKLTRQVTNNCAFRALSRARGTSDKDNYEEMRKTLGFRIGRMLNYDQVEKAAKVIYQLDGIVVAGHPAKKSYMTFPTTLEDSQLIVVLRQNARNDHVDLFGDIAKVTFRQAKQWLQQHGYTDTEDPQRIRQRKMDRRHGNLRTKTVLSLSTMTNKEIGKLYVEEGLIAFGSRKLMIDRFSIWKCDPREVEEPSIIEKLNRMNMTQLRLTIMTKKREVTGNTKEELRAQAWTVHGKTYSPARTRKVKRKKEEWRRASITKRMSTRTQGRDARTKQKGGKARTREEIYAAIAAKTAAKGAAAVRKLRSPCYWLLQSESVGLQYAIDVRAEKGLLYLLCLRLGSIATKDVCMFSPAFRVLLYFRQPRRVATVVPTRSLRRWTYNKDSETGEHDFRRINYKVLRIKVLVLTKDKKSAKGEENGITDATPVPTEIPTDQEEGDQEYNIRLAKSLSMSLVHRKQVGYTISHEVILLEKNLNITHWRPEEPKISARNLWMEKNGEATDWGFRVSSRGMKIECVVEGSMAYKKGLRNGQVVKKIGDVLIEEGKDITHVELKRRKQVVKDPEEVAAKTNNEYPTGEGSCGLMMVAKEVAASLEKYSVCLDHRFDKCYCQKCYEPGLPDTMSNQGPTAYVVPRGWVRLGLKVPPRATTNDIFNKWSVSFHGVKSINVLKSILDCGSLLKPGDRLIDGTKLWSKKCADRQDSVTYTSPTVRYAGLKFYAEPQLFRSKVMKKDMNISIVVQCRQNPEHGVIQKRGETMGFNREWGRKHLEKTCPHANQSELEWMIGDNVSTHTIVYGILLRCWPKGQDVMHNTYKSPVDGDDNWGENVPITALPAGATGPTSLMQPLHKVPTACDNTPTTNDKDEKPKWGSEETNGPRKEQMTTHATTEKREDRQTIQLPSNLVEKDKRGEGTTRNEDTKIKKTRNKTEKEVKGLEGRTMKNNKRKMVNLTGQRQKTAKKGRDRKRSERNRTARQKQQRPLRNKNTMTTRRETKPVNLGNQRTGEDYGGPKKGVEENRTKIGCRFFRKGICNKGDRCIFSHANHRDHCRARRRREEGKRGRGRKHVRSSRQTGRDGGCNRKITRHGNDAPPKHFTNARNIARHPKERMSK